TSGTCGIMCSAGYSNCDGNASNGCEVHSDSDLSNCGACGHVCNSTNGSATCTNGTCGIVCATGYLDCDGNPNNGCEVHSDTDPSNCGACNHVRTPPNAIATCTRGTCGINCNTGYKDCDGNASTGCEVHSDADTANCGACGHVCNSTNGT